jgi:hypothetical protein
VPHPLHIKVAEVIVSITEKHGLKVLLDEACIDRKSSKILQHLPFFLSDEAHNDTEVTNVDILVLKGDDVRLICEIEESDISPIRTFGKVFSAASSTFYKLKNGKTKKVGNDGIFIQILSSKKLKKEKTSKPYQGKNIETAVNEKLSKCNFWIKKYHLTYLNEDDFFEKNERCLEFEGIIKSLCRSLA